MTGKKRTFGSAVKKILLFLNLLAVLALMAAYTALYTDPRNFWPLAFFGLSYPIILVINLFFVLIWILFWKKFAFISLLLILAGFNQILTLYPVRLTAQGEPPAGAFRILSYNIHGFRSPGKENTSSQEEILRFLDRVKPAVVCFQEFTPRGHENAVSLGNRLVLTNAYFQNYYPDNKRGVASGLAIYSLFPMTGSSYLIDSQNRVFATWVDLAVGGDTIRCFNLHLAPIRFGSKEVAFYDNLINNETIHLGHGLQGMLGKLKKAFLNRSEQVDRLSDALKRSPFPVVIAGDFNDTPFSYSYHRVTGNLKDAYRQAGSGLFGNTYAGELPSFRIDYILYDPGYRAYRYIKYPVNYSDHYPVSTLIAPDRQTK
jgi:endonuclease/exonuclease/phosphatase family metal-dependent hydrolase